MTNRRLAILSFVALAGASVAFAEQSGFPPARTTDIPVSAITYMPAAGRQSSPMAASNGDVTLSVWADARDSEATYATLVASDGRPMQPLGLRLPLIYNVKEVFWNGDSFSVLGGTLQTDYILVFVSASGEVLGTKPLSLPAVPGFTYRASNGDGATTRLLFLSSDLASTVVDAQGNVVSSFVRAASLTNVRASSNPPVGRGADFGFLVMLPTNDAGVLKIYAVKLDRDGRITDFVDAKLPFDTIEENTVVEAGADGFLLVVRRWMSPGIQAYKLDAGGVFTGHWISITEAPSDYGVTMEKTQVVWDGSRYVVGWDERDGGNSKAYVAAVDADATRVSDRHLLTTGVAGVAFVRKFKQPLVFTAGYRGGLSDSDVYVQRLSPSLEPDDLKWLAYTSTRQKGATVVATPTGYAVAWTEEGPDQYHLYLRRFTWNGAPFDPEPIELKRGEATYSPFFARLISTASGVVVATSRADGWAEIRRLSDRPGEWRDPEPVRLAAAYAAIVTNGRDLLTVGSESACQSATGGRCINAQRVELGASIVPLPPVQLPASASPGAFAAASNGTDYLLVWSDGYLPCNTSSCPQPPTRTLGLRVRADATAIDREPFVIEGEIGSGRNPSVAWNGDRYVVVWIAKDGVRAATVTSEGAVRDVDPTTGGTLIQSATWPEAIAAVKIIAVGEAFAVVTKSATYAQAPQHPVTWSAVAFCTTCDLRDVIKQPRSTLLHDDDELYGFGSFDISVEGRSLVIAFDRTGAADSGLVRRVFSRVFAPLPPRRRSVGH